MLEAYEIFDASNDQLTTNLLEVQLLLQHAVGQELFRLQQLQQLIQQELEERGCSATLFEQLLPKDSPSPALPNLPAAGLKSGLQQALQQLVATGQAVAGSVQHLTTATVPATATAPAKESTSSSLGRSHAEAISINTLDSSQTSATHVANHSQFAAPATHLPSPTHFSNQIPADNAYLLSNPNFFAALPALPDHTVNNNLQIQLAPAAPTNSANAQLARVSCTTAPPPSDISTNQSLLDTPGQAAKSSYSLDKAFPAAGSLASSQLQTEASHVSLCEDATTNGLHSCMAAEASEASLQAAEEAGASLEGAEQVKDSSTPAVRPLSVWEAAMEAFKAEQAMVRKAKKAIQKGPAKGQVKKAAPAAQHSSQPQHMSHACSAGELCAPAKDRRLAHSHSTRSTATCADSNVQADSAGYGTKTTGTLNPHTHVATAAMAGRERRCSDHTVHTRCDAEVRAVGKISATHMPQPRPSISQASEPESVHTDEDAQAMIELGNQSPEAATVSDEEPAMQQLVRPPSYAATPVATAAGDEQEQGISEVESSYSSEYYSDDEERSASSSHGQSAPASQQRVDAGPHKRAMVASAAPQVDRWADWELDANTDVSAWGTAHDDDSWKTRDTSALHNRHAPPQALSHATRERPAGNSITITEPSEQASLTAQSTRLVVADSLVQQGMVASILAQQNTMQFLNQNMPTQMPPLSPSRSPLPHAENPTHRPVLLSGTKQAPKHVQASSAPPQSYEHVIDAATPLVTSKPPLPTGTFKTNPASTINNSRPMSPSAFVHSGQEESAIKLLQAQCTSVSSASDLDSRSAQSNQISEGQHGPSNPINKVGRPPLPAASTSTSSSSTRNPSPYMTPRSYPVSHYGEHFAAFHEILSICHSALSVLDQSQLSLTRPSSARPPVFEATDILDKYASIAMRCAAWLEALHKQQQQHLGSHQSQPSVVSLVQSSRLTGNHAISASIINSNGASVVHANGAQQATQQPLVHATVRPPYSPTSSRPPSIPSTPGLTPRPDAPTEFVKYYSVYDDTVHPEVRQILNVVMKDLPGWQPDPVDQVTEESSAADSMSNGGITARPTSSSMHGSASSGDKVQGRCHMWNLLWSWSVKVAVPFNSLMVWQRVNHFQEAKQLTRKDLLSKHLLRYQVMHSSSRLGHLFHMIPTTFTLPRDAAAFQEAWTKALHGVEPTIVQPQGLNLWIQKPIGMSRGRGIRLISRLRDAESEELTVVQRYVTSPLLVSGYKFDLRLYVLVSSFNPLEAWLHTEGFARFATAPFSLDEASLGDRFVHLTNSSVQKERVEQGQLPPFLEKAEPAGGSKCSLAQLRQLLVAQHVDWTSMWEHISQMITAALFAAQDAIPYCVNSFELFGFDVLLDSNLKPWLLEVNSSPSLGLDTPLDRQIKPQVVRDIIELLQPLGFDRRALQEVLQQRTTGKSRKRGGGLMSGTMSEEREMGARDLQAVLGGALPRRYGQTPHNVGGFQCLAPAPLYEKLLKLRRPL